MTEQTEEQHLCNQIKLESSNSDQEKRTRLESQLNICKEGQTPQKITSIKDCILNAVDMFATTKAKWESNTRLKHPPIKQPSQRVRFSVRGEIHKMVGDMLEAGVVQESSSPWASPIILVKKRTEAYVFVQTTANSMLSQDVFPLPRIDDLLDQFKGKSVFHTGC